VTANLIAAVSQWWSWVGLVLLAASQGQQWAIGLITATGLSHTATRFSGYGSLGD